MRLSTLDAVLLACVLACAGIVTQECQAVVCDTQCRYITIYAKDDGNGSYSCLSLENPDCGVCTGKSRTPTGGCDNTLNPGKGICKQDATLPQQRATATGTCNIVCPLPPQGYTQASAIAGTVWNPVMGGTWVCVTGS